MKKQIEETFICGCCGESELTENQVVKLDNEDGSFACVNCHPHLFVEKVVIPFNLGTFGENITEDDLGDCLAAYSDELEDQFPNADIEFERNEQVSNPAKQVIMLDDCEFFDASNFKAEFQVAFERAMSKL